MKKKVICVVALALMSASSTFALSPIKMGLKAGITAQTAKLNHSQLKDYSLSTNSRVGGQIGAFARLNLLLFHIQPELIYSMNRYELTATPSSIIARESSSVVKQNSLDVPVLFGMKFLIFRVNAGPVFNIMNEGSVRIEDDIKHSVDYLKSSVSYALGVGIDLDKVSIDLRYNGQFKKSTQSIAIGELSGISGNSGDFKSSYGNWAFTLGYAF